MGKQQSSQSLGVHSKLVTSFVLDYCPTSTHMETFRTKPKMGGELNAHVQNRSAHPMYAAKRRGQNPDPKSLKPTHADLEYKDRLYDNVQLKWSFYFRSEWLTVKQRVAICTCVPDTVSVKHDRNIGVHR